MSFVLEIDREPERSPSEIQESVLNEADIRAREHLYHKFNDLIFHVEDQRRGTVAFYSRATFLRSQDERLHRIQKMCSLNKSYSTRESKGRILVNNKRRLMYCPVAKVASTFLKRLWFAAETGLSIQTPFDVSLSSIQIARTSKRDVSVRKYKTSMIEQFQRMLFVREPFSKMFSAYVDKLFAPNPTYWKLLGRKIIKQVRQNPSWKSLMCGHDVRFEELVKFVINAEKKKQTQDEHFVSTNAQCAVCSVNYTLIGKMETLMQDVAFVLELLGQNVSKKTLDTWTPKFQVDAIMDSTFSPFGWKANISQCMSFHEAGKRIWHKLQIRGIISKHSKMPYDENEMANVTAPQFIEKLFKYKQSPEQVKRQKKEAIQKAFSTVPQTDIAAYRRLFKPDFELFGYNMFSEKLFPPEGVAEDESTWVFDLTNV